MEQTMESIASGKASLAEEVQEKANLKYNNKTSHDEYEDTILEDEFIVTGEDEDDPEYFKAEEEVVKPLAARSD
jgi:hypothetical protein